MDAMQARGTAETTDHSTFIMHARIQAPLTQQTTVKTQLERIVALYSQDGGNGMILSKDLIHVLDEYERQYNVLLLTEPQKQAILPHCIENPELEMSMDDIVNLLSLVTPPAGEPEQSTLDCSPSMVVSDATVPSLFNDERESNLDSGEADTRRRSSLLEEERYSSYYGQPIDRLRLSEQHLATMTRDNESRIVELQNRVDDMTIEVARQRKEIGEYKCKEKNSLAQITAMEGHIASIQRSATDHKQVYTTLKSLFDEKCDETQQLQDLLKNKESDLETTESFLSSVQHEFVRLMEERDRLAKLQSSLERELERSRNAHEQLAEQKTENLRLKEIIDSLRCDLDEARLEQSDPLAHGSELIPDLSPKSLHHEPAETLPVYKEAPPYVASKDPDLGSHRLSSDQPSLMRELAISDPSLNDSPIKEDETIEALRQAKARQRRSRTKSRIIHDYHASPVTSVVMATPRLSRYHYLVSGRAGHQQTNDKAVTNAITFALYTLLIYIFGIVTSTFLIENGQPGSWEQALVAAASSSSHGQRSKLLEILLYWIEKLLSEGDGMPLQ